MAKKNFDVKKVMIVMNIVALVFIVLVLSIISFFKIKFGDSNLSDEIKFNIIETIIILLFMNTGVFVFKILEK